MTIKQQMELAERLKKEYPQGTEILLITMGEDIHRIPDNTKGVVKYVDDIGTIHCTFENGRNLGLIYGEDNFKKI